MWRSRALTAAFGALAGVLVTPAAMAATSNTAVPVSGAMALRLAPAASTLLDRTGHFTSLSMIGVTLPALSQESSPARPNLVASDVAQGVHLELAHGNNWEAFGDILAPVSALRSTYLSGTSSYVGATFALTDDLSFSFSQSSWGFGVFGDNQPSQFTRDLADRLAPDLRSAGTTSASFSWNFSDWGGVAITASHSSGNGSLLGIVPGSLNISGSADTTTLGISARVGFGEGWVTTVAYSGGVSQLDLSRNQLMTNTDPVSLHAFGVGFAKQGVFGADALGIAVSRPLQVYSGGLNAALAGQQARESDVELGYVTSFLDGTIALQANAAYQVNAAGTQGQNALTGVARAKLKF